ncbi:hypothetical protein HC174_08905 [Salinimicrobium sp. CDJ15-81-2]|uniref:CARDB domain-containing protein n=1 Tax=Tamlana crocina TaxID=393006 RepID=A0ABX1DF11_9FLAO|nr:hypothetical protein [Tamlana crocina]NJX16913.1 hypothetical protein [Tamlana crocina]NJY62874.1 hypothetical protein [Salinimicrobium nanhaiense]
MGNKNERNILENITFYSGIVILIILLIYLGFGIVKNDNKPPELTVSISEDPNSAGTKYKIEVENVGEKTAEAAIINFELYDNGKVAGKAELQIGYVPQHSKEIGFIVFPGQQTPADSIVINSMSYIQP